MNHFGKYCKTKYNLNTVRSNISSTNVETSEVKDDDALFIGVIDKGDCKFRSVITVSFYEINKQVEFKLDTGSDVDAIPEYIFKKLDLSCKLAPFNAEDLQNALDAIRKDGRKIREVGRCFKIPEWTLRKKLSEDDLKLPRLGRKTVFTQDTEVELKEYILLLSKLFYGLTPGGLRRLAFRYAEHHSINHNFNRKTGLAGKHGFMVF
ncbi:hypothetical protein QE152_g24830 [Popillia japonica]|uniref:Uncharacterized protein n=1 Tax=Popillia japonica TaxID=7064 RepID=A0AAW1K4Q6_POPJA